MVVPERGCSAAAAHFQVVPAYPAETSANQTFSSSVKCSEEISHETLSAGWKREAGVEIIGFWATSSCNQHVISVSAQVHSLQRSKSPMICCLEAGEPGKPVG